MSRQELEILSREVAYLLMLLSAGLSPQPNQVLLEWVNHLFKLRFSDPQSPGQKLTNSRCYSTVALS